MCQGDVPDVDKQRQPVPRDFAAGLSVDQVVDRLRTRVHLVPTRDFLKRRAIDHRRVQRRDDHVGVGGGKVQGGALGEGLARRIDARAGQVRALFQGDRVPVRGGVGVVAPLSSSEHAVRTLSCSCKTAGPGN